MLTKGKDIELKHFTVFPVFEISLNWNLIEVRVLIMFFLNFSIFTPLMLLTTVCFLKA